MTKEEFNNISFKKGMSAEMTDLTFGEIIAVDFEDNSVYLKDGFIWYLYTDIKTIE